LKILQKTNDELILLAVKSEMVSKGDYFLIEDTEMKRQLIVQVYNEEYLSNQSIIEDIVKDEIIRATSPGVSYDPLEIGLLSCVVRDSRLLKTKIRGSSIGANNNMSSDISWLPSRVNSKIRRLTNSELNHILNRGGESPISIGFVGNSQDPFIIYAEDLDGRLNIITGKKESGKSHLSKLLVKSLLEHEAFVLVFDLNNEYAGLGIKTNGLGSTVESRVILLEPGKNLRFSLEYCGKPSVSSMLKNALDMPSTSLREFFRIWDNLQKRQSLTLEAFSHAINNWNFNDLVRDALISRIHTIHNSRLFLNDEKNDEHVGFRFENLISNNVHGLAMIVNLGTFAPTIRHMVVELILNKLVELLGNNVIPPIFLFAEEAHLYIKETYWDDIITRMRHFGIYSTFITNHPEALGEGILRQVDNIFLFNFVNESDLERISKISLVDKDTIKSIVRTLPQRYSLLIGKMVQELPIVVKVPNLDIKAYGETKKFFRRKSPTLLSSK
jgi:DNA helicase HerA-like ATPase